MTHPVSSCFPRVSCVVVTYNRLALLKSCIAAIRSQKTLPDDIIVVNNDSSDGTTEWLSAQSDLVVFHQGTLGSSGGQHRGVVEAWNRGSDWVWLMDDDTIPDPDCLAAMLRSDAAADPSTGFLCSVVRWTDGSLHRMNGPNLYPSFDELMKWMPRKAIRVTTASFVSCMVQRRAIDTVGLPLKEMFVWYDDAEYTRRISDLFSCFLVLDSTVEHRSRTNHLVDFKHMAGLAPSYLRHGLRNHLFMERMAVRPGFRRLRRTVNVSRQLCALVFAQFSGPDRMLLIRGIAEGVFFSPKPEWPEAVAPPRSDG